MTSRILLAAAAAVLLLSASPARADDDMPFAGKAPYVSFGGVYGHENVGGIPGGLSDSGGYDIRLGYNLHDMFALEGEWTSFLSFSRNSVDPITNNSDPALEARMLSLNGRFSPLNGRFQPYALIGGGWFNVQADRVGNSVHESSFAMRFGLGLAAYLTQRTGVAIEGGYILPLSGRLGGGDSFDLIPVTASIFFRFK